MISLIAFSVLILSCMSYSQNHFHALPQVLSEFAHCMSAEAYSDMRSTSAIRKGISVLAFFKDSTSNYGYSLSVGYCPLPGTDSITLLRINHREDSLINLDVESMRPFADFDSSGFITKTEAARFRTLIETEMFADYLATKGEPESRIGHIFWFSNFSSEQLGELISDYKTMQRKSTDRAESVLPHWPFPN